MTDAYEDLIRSLPEGKARDLITSLPENEVRQAIKFGESMQLMVGILWRDVVSARDFLVEKHSDQFRRRVFIRAVFAFIEGSLNAISKVILRQHEILDYQLTKKDFEVLTEMSQEKDEKRPKYLKLDEKIRKVFTILATKAGKIPSYKLKESNDDIVCFKAAIALRHRLTHPKILGDLEVKDSDLTNIEEAITWYSERFFELDKPVSETMNKETNKLYGLD